MDERKILLAKGLLRSNERPLFDRLEFKAVAANAAPLINDQNRAVRDEIFSFILSNTVEFHDVSDAISSESPQDRLISEIDRFGLPLRTVINLNTGLIRSTPYYSASWLSVFYEKYYRPLYTDSIVNSKPKVLSEQILRGDSYLNFMNDYLNEGDSILEVGCGLGGILIPFMMKGYNVKGIDFGSDYVNAGNRLGLNLSCETLGEVKMSGKKFNLIILSHLLEHVLDLSTFIEELKSVLADDGLLFIAVPGVESIHKTYKGDLLMYLQNAHVWSFTNVTLSTFLKRSGFKVLKIDKAIHCVCRIGVDSDTDTTDVDHEVLKYLTSTEQKFMNKESVKGKIKEVLRIIKR